MKETIRILVADDHPVLRDGLIAGAWLPSSTGQNRRYYEITAKGTTSLASMLEEWNLFTHAVNLVAQPEGLS